ncbi:hypothetical protein [Streptomyces hyaluromycini]|uniref:hypothetical protein n=1 Tax=Streptomyces hyaluromycini TaxID=1377993 RepID=UPI00142D2EAD|nr:hypothetical protein [Streptomyces hyaluromycini]
MSFFDVLCPYPAVADIVDQTLGGSAGGAAGGGCVLLGWSPRANAASPVLS